mmetsp:Transcript_13724/g.41468  ORF Transcript_13724/g.41468 Transcript_13724/m.41468 type:complete len:561 (+) Transcript_13724:174-1856(+)
MPVAVASSGVQQPVQAMQGTMFRRLSVQPSLTRALRAVPRHYAWRHQQSALHATAATSAPTAPTIPGKSVYTDLMRGNGTDPSILNRRKPADIDRSNFQQLPSVEFWRTFRPAEGVDDSKSAGSQISAVLQRIQEGARTTGALSSAQSVAYWTYHLGRMTFFALQGIIGLASARSSSVAAGEAEGGTGRRLERLVGSGLAGPIVEALATYAADLENIKAGQYKLPWDMTTQLHRQYNPLYVLPRALWFWREAGDTLDRRDTRATTDVWLQSNLGYPDYSLNTFHYQTDGWMSARSAEIYEVSTETLFIGKQDAMQRQTLVPLSAHMAARAPTGAGMKALEVACGTGRFATFVKDNYPDMEMTCLDLSPFYLAKARENLKYWRSKRAPGSIDTDKFIQAAAETIPAPDNSYDVVTCVYLFHELPAEARRAAAAEMARVLAPGGMLVLTDSVQLGDREAFDPTLGNFENFNEPYYGTYIAEDLGALFVDAGLTPGVKTVASSTKALSFTKPLSSPHNSTSSTPSGASIKSSGSSEGSNAPAGRPLMVGRSNGQPSAGLQAST